MNHPIYSRSRKLARDRALTEGVAAQLIDREPPQSLLAETSVYIACPVCHFETLFVADRCTRCGTEVQ